MIPITLTMMPITPIDLETTRLFSMITLVTVFIIFAGVLAWADRHIRI